MNKDLAVSKLSRLQKQILIYARRQMLAKDQVIEPCDAATISIPAPQWLAKALTTALEKIFFTRKTHGPLEEDGFASYQVHPWMFFFEEIAFMEETIRQAAKEAGRRTRNIELTRLYETALDPFADLILATSYKIQYHPWPVYRDGWWFEIKIPNTTGEELKTFLDGRDAAKGLQVDGDPLIPKNCSVPEMLRDLFDFPVQKGGHIDALAFDHTEIGEARYNRAQASLRRACSRLHDRKLLVVFLGQTVTLVHNTYGRTSIGLTEAGITIADALIETADARAKADLGLASIAPQPEHCVSDRRQSP
jgi:hypothetical protein